MNLRPYQSEAIAGVRDAFRQGHKRVLLVAPTGAGKTVMFSHLTQALAAAGNRVLLLAHRDFLLDQIAGTLRACGVECGFIAAKRPLTLGHRVQVASVQTLRNRLDIWRPDWIICDEAHHATAGSWAMVLGAYHAARVIGVTATPQRLDGKGLGDVFQAMVRGPEVAALMEGGFLARAVYFCPHTVDTTGLRMRMGEFRAGDVDAACNTARVTGEAVTHYKRRCDGAPAVAFCASIKHAEHVAETFRAAGYRWASLDSSMTDAARRAAVDGLRTGTLHGLSSCDIISEGFDLPHVTAAILLRPTKSLGLHLQQIGRVLRPAQGKAHAVIIDHVGNVGRNADGAWQHNHGFADDEREWTLEGKPTRPKAPAVILCPECFAAYGGGRCPQCGYQREQEPERGIPTVDETAELEAVDPAAARAQERAARTLEDLRAIGEARGYKPGWAWHRWMARQRTTKYRLSNV
jgi:superfamily II DNA or RNA helicase